MWPTPLITAISTGFLTPLPLPRDHGDLTSPAPSRDHGILSSGKENAPPHKLPRKLRPRRRREKQSGSTANHNSPSREAGREKQPGPTANHNSPSREAGNQPGTSRSTGSAMRAPVKHPLTFLRPQHPRLTANHNSGRRFDPDHSESGRLYKPARSSIQEDSALRSRRDSFSASGLSSPALQRSHRDSFSGSPSGLTRNISLTDPIREARIAGGLRPGPVQPHPRAACPDTRLDVDAAPPEAAAVSRAERPPTVLDIPESGRLETTRCQNHLKGVDLGQPGATRANGPGIALQRYTGPRSAHHTLDTGVNSVFPLV